MKNKDRKHWIIVGLLCLMASSSIGLCMNSVGVFYVPVSKELNVLKGTFAFHATLSLLATATTSMMMPKIMKRFKYKTILITGVSMATLATVAMAFSRHIALFYVLAIIRGIGAGCYANAPLTMIITNWFHQKHGLATSIALSFSGLSGAIFTPVLSYALEHYGITNAYLIMAFFIAVLPLFAILYPMTMTPEQSSLLPYGYVSNEKVAIKQNATSFNYKSFLYISVCLFAFIHSTIVGISQHLSGFAMSIGYSLSISALMMSSTMIGNIVFKLVVGALSDKIGAVKATITMIALNAFSLVVLLFVGQNTILLVIGSFLFGSVYSVGAVALPLLTKLFFKQENYLKAFSIIGALANLGSALSLPFIGYLYDFTKSYVLAFKIGIAIHLFNIVFLLYINKRNNEQSYFAFHK